jgi:ribosome maturation factor RimP
MAPYIFSGLPKSGLPAHFFFGAMGTVVDTQKLSDMVEPVVRGLGYELVDLEWKREPQGWVLRVFIDRSDEGGVSLDDCADVSHQLSTTLDVADAITVAYHLEVSSPGLNRPLKKEADFRRFVGKKAKIRTRHPIGENRRNFSGVLLGVTEGKVQIDVGDQVCQVPVADVEKANLIYEFENGR